MKKRLVQMLGAPQLDDDQTVPDDLIGRLYGASESAVADLVGDYSSDQRANLAMLFYRKAHLRPIGLAIAATCDFPTLVQVWGPTRGKAPVRSVARLLAGAGSRAAQDHACEIPDLPPAACRAAGRRGG